VNDQHLRTRLDLLGAGPATADWGDALRRAAGLRRRRTRLALLAAAAVILVAAPAFAITTDVIDFGSAEPAPEEWRRVFAEMDKTSVRGGASLPGAPFSEARLVLSREIDGKRHTLNVAPKKGGGFCLYRLEELVPGGGGGSAACVDAGDPLTRFGELFASERPRGIYGSSAVPGARQVEVILADGTTARTDLVWVSEPIDAGLYLLEVPAGSVTESFVARDAEGRELVRRALPGK
jgi:hypothetical protein